MFAKIINLFQDVFAKNEYDTSSSSMILKVKILISKSKSQEGDHHLKSDKEMRPTVFNSYVWKFYLNLTDEQSVVFAEIIILFQDVFDKKRIWYEFI